MQKKVTVQKVHPMQILTQNDLILPKVMVADYADMYLFELETVKQLKAMELQYKMWSKQPVFVEKLKQLRDWLVKPFGLQGGFMPVESLLSAGEHREQREHDGVMTDEMMICKNDHEKFIADVLCIIANVYYENHVFCACWRRLGSSVFHVKHLQNYKGSETETSDPFVYAVLKNIFPSVKAECFLCDFIADFGKLTTSRILQCHHASK